MEMNEFKEKLMHILTSPNNVLIKHYETMPCSDSILLTCYDGSYFSLQLHTSPLQKIMTKEAESSNTKDMLSSFELVRVDNPLFYKIYSALLHMNHINVISFTTFLNIVDGLILSADDLKTEYNIGFSDNS